MKIMSTLQNAIEALVLNEGTNKMESLDGLAEAMAATMNRPDPPPRTRQDKLDAYLACAAYFHKKAEPFFRGGVKEGLNTP